MHLNKLQNKILPIVFGLGVMVFSSCQPDEQTSASDLDGVMEQALLASSSTNHLSDFELPASNNLSRIPQDPNNPLTPQKIELGKLLFHETALAMNPLKSEGLATYSCASCHHSRAGFQACKPQGIGEGGIGFGANGIERHKDDGYDISEIDVQPLRSPSILNAAYQEVQLWNGQFGATGLNRDTKDRWANADPTKANFWGFEGTETQAIAGLTVHRMGIETALADYPEYKEMFDDAFSDFAPENRYSLITAGLAIAAYERTVLANQSPFQRWLKGDYEAMSDSEKNGAILFFNKANCASCHNGPALNTMEFYALGMGNLEFGIESEYDPNDNAHKGRGGFTGNDEDNYKFKVPQLYNLKDSPFYGHGATFNSIREVVEYKNNAVAAESIVSSEQLAKEFVPLNLTDEEIDQITDFIEKSLNDPNLNRYDPPSLPSGNCFPNNDNTSQSDLGCS